MNSEGIAESASLLERAAALMAAPTAPFREQWALAALDRQIAAIPGLEKQTDRFGNRIVRLRRGRSGETGEVAVFVAHTDHPGFLFPLPEGARSEGGARRYRAVFEGRVRDPFFVNAPVRLFRSADDPGVAGRIVEFTPVLPESDNRQVLIETEEDASGAALAMWDLPVFSVQEGVIHGRACDDLLGCAVILEALARLAADPAATPLDVAAVFTRAEEAGFCGALCLMAEERTPAPLPREPLFVSVEISGETAVAPLGEGAVIRAGDRSTTFDGRVTDILWAHARDQKLNARRALMDRGTCEATVFARVGYRAAGVCAPVRHYHNMNTEVERLAPEQVSHADAEALVELLRGLGLALSSDHAAESGVLRKREFEAFLRKGRQMLGGGNGESKSPLAPGVKKG